MSLGEGVKLGRYEIRAHIGTGGMGQVYLAHDTSELSRTVALKLLPHDIATDPKRMQRFIREARTVSSLNHPNVLTIYEFGVHDSTRFMAMEYVEGVTLRDHLNDNRLNLHEVLDIGIQVAAALNAAHEAHVVHRDIKPENIMLRRRDGIVKVLDFGLAKPVKHDGNSGGTSELLHTETGIVMGSVSYMSPEQSRASKTLDYRTDIWSLGAVLYEMIAGQVPFEGKDLFKQIVAIQEEPHTPLSDLVAHVPPELEHIVDKALAKNPDDRYRTATDMLADMRNVKRQLENTAEYDRTAIFDKRRFEQWGRQSSPRHASGSTTTQPSGPYPVSSAEYIVNQVKLHKRGALVLLGIVVLAMIGTLFWYFKHTRVAPLTDKDTILLTDFENKTGEEVFDGTLRQGLAVQLQQSPFLDIFPETRTRATLQLMSLSPDERVTRERAREICQRQGLKAFIAGTIVKFERNYSITLEALNGQTGDQVALVQVEAEGKDQVLKALSRAASELREKLGESLSSIQKFDAKLEVTTSSLEALKEYAHGRNEQDKGQSFKAIDFYKRATEIDANFAVAWLGLALQYSNTGQPGLASQCLKKAFELSNRVSEDERARITYFYYQIVTGELEKAIEAQEAYVRSYPRAARGPGNLGNLYSITGQYEKAVAATTEAQRLNPNTTIWPGNLAEALIGLNRFDEARNVCRQALAQKLDSTSIRERLYAVAFVSSDAPAMQEQIAWAKGRTDEYRAVYWQAQSSSFAGKWRESNEHLSRATELALRAEAKEVVAAYTADQALRAAWLGQFAQSLKLAESALELQNNRIIVTRVALAFALAGDADRAAKLVEIIEELYFNDTMVTQVWLPQIKAAIELRENNAPGAFELLETTRRYEPAAGFSPQTLRSMVYLKLGQPAQAAAEARRILDHRGQAPLSLLWPLAHLTLARSSAMQGDTAQARKSYQEFFTLWRDADPDIPILTAEAGIRERQAGVVNDPEDLSYATFRVEFPPNHLKEPPSMNLENIFNVVTPVAVAIGGVLGYAVKLRWSREFEKAMEARVTAAQDAAKFAQEMSATNIAEKFNALKEFYEREASFLKTCLAKITAERDTVIAQRELLEQENNSYQREIDYLKAQISELERNIVVTEEASKLMLEDSYKRNTVEKELANFRGGRALAWTRYENAQKGAKSEAAYRNAMATAAAEAEAKGEKTNSHRAHFPDSKP